jgi:hypothetical protein
VPLAPLASDAENQRSHQHAHQVDTTSTELRGNQPDERTRAERADADEPSKEVGESDQQAEDENREMGVLHPPDRPQVAVANERNEHESDASSERDAREQEWQVERDACRIERDQYTCAGRAERDERKEGENRVRFRANNAKIDVLGRTETM